MAPYIMYARNSVLWNVRLHRRVSQPSRAVRTPRIIDKR